LIGGSGPGGFGLSGLLVIFTLIKIIREEKGNVKTSPYKTDFGARAVFGGKEDYHIFQ
jgi:hypothetical protein